MPRILILQLSAITCRSTNRRDVESTSWKSHNDDGVQSPLLITITDLYCNCRHGERQSAADMVKDMVKHDIAWTRIVEQTRHLVDVPLKHRADNAHVDVEHEAESAVDHLDARIERRNVDANRDIPIRFDIDADL